MTRTDFYDSRNQMMPPSAGVSHLPLHHSETAIREAVGLFSSAEELQNAVRELEGTEFPRQDISVLGGWSEVESVFGRTVADLEDMPDTPRQAPARPEEKTIGASVLIGGSAYIGVIAMALAAGPLSIPATIAAIAIGGGSGAVIGGGIAKLLEEHYAKSVQEQISKGGLLLWVRTPDPAHERLACDILTSNGATHVKIHEIV